MKINIRPLLIYRTRENVDLFWLDVNEYDEENDDYIGLFSLVIYFYPVYKWSRKDNWFCKNRSYEFTLSTPYIVFELYKWWK